MGKKPVTLVRVKSASKRLKRPQILEVGQFFEMLKHLAEPYRTMVMVAQCTGLRISEILGLQWGDFNFEDHTFLVQRSSMGGRIDIALKVKQEFDAKEKARAKKKPPVKTTPAKKAPARR